MKGFKVSIFCSFVNLLYVFVCFNLFLIKIPYVFQPVPRLGSNLKIENSEFKIKSDK